MPLRLDNAKCVAHMPTAGTAKNKSFEPRFKIDHAAAPMPETKQPERLAPRATSNRNGGRDHLGILGEIKSVHPGEIIGIRKEVLNVEKITGNDIFTCYTAMKAVTKTPRAFPQALRDTEGKSFHYIEVKAWDDIVVPISGSNYFHHDLKRKEAAE
ncbi:hypothetical protein AB7M45_007191 [Bradyrhizobium elkanii]|uniref:hypothetical protein n=2 Tax=Bradyrhizobium elkanii TaxID=29448 RepID=UPI00222708B4|nr:hypothetical protein [Bradyrhizobium elkanii]MCW2194420.1 hypothetical protein [Bradyrhizobium elkanii]